MHWKYITYSINLFLLLPIYFFAVCNKDNTEPEKQPIIERINISVGVGYASNIYYSMSNGEKGYPLFQYIEIISKNQ